MDNGELDGIIGFLQEDSGLCFAGRRKAALSGQLEGRLATLGLADLSGYGALLRESAAERGELYDRITVNETSFFRNKQQFEDLRQVVIPAIQREKSRPRGAGKRQPPRRIRVLSAGCSTGEEPYSLAMTLLESVGCPPAWELEVVAGDLSGDCLKTAARGWYADHRLRGIPHPYRERYLARDGEGWLVREEVRRLVSFQRLNLARIMAGGELPGMAGDFAGFDVILCRNVLIYFPPATQQALIDSLQRLLAPHGYLLTGDAEPLHLYRHELETVAEAASLIYRKKGAATVAGRHYLGGGVGGGGQAPGGASPLAGEREMAGGQAPDGASTLAGERTAAGLGVEGLLLAVANSSLGLRDEALGRLLVLGLEAIFPVLERAVRNDRAADLRNGAMETLVRFGEAAVPRLSSLLTDGNDEVRNFAAVMLGAVGSRRALPALIGALKDPDPNVRHGAAEALGKIGDPAAALPLIALLDQGFWLQFPAIAALGELGSPAALPRLLELIDDELLFEPVVRALVRIGDPLALPRLSAAARGADPHRARIAARAVSELENDVMSRHRARAAAAC